MVLRRICCSMRRSSFSSPSIWACPFTQASRVSQVAGQGEICCGEQLATALTMHAFDALVCRDIAGRLLSSLLMQLGLCTVALQLGRILRRAG